MQLRKYFAAPLIPGLATLITAIAATALFLLVLEPTSSISGPHGIVLAVCLFAPAVVAMIGLIVSVVQAVRRSWTAALFNFFLALGSATVATAVMLGSAFSAMFIEAPDTFGRDIVIPKDLRMRLPAERPPDTGPVGDATLDADGAAVLESCKTQGDAPGSRTVSIALGGLDDLTGPSARLLLDRLTRSPAWFVGEERGHRYAYRRFLNDQGRWENSLNGFYSPGSCQVRIVIGFDGDVFAEPWSRSGAATFATTKDTELALKVRRDEGSMGPASYLVLRSKQLAVEIYDEAPSEDRAVTRAALNLVGRELAAVDAESPNPHVQTAGEVSTTLDLVQGMQGGIYLVYAQVNPAEPGYGYLKIYEHTRSTRLSASRVDLSSKQILGWSKSPNERFLYHVETTVYEGDWGVYYPARFELWFVPESGAGERKLLEDVFKIEGWQR